MGVTQRKTWSHGSAERLLTVAVVVGLVSLAWGNTSFTNFSKNIFSGSVLNAFNQLGYAQENEDSLRAMIHNVTTDMDQLILIVEDFLDTQEDRTKLKSEFKEFLLQAEKTSFVSVERTLGRICMLTHVPLLCKLLFHLLLTIYPFACLMTYFSLCLSVCLSVCRLSCYGI